MTITPESLAGVSDEELRSRLMRAETELENLRSAIPAAAMRRARSSGVDLGPVREALESFGFDPPGQTRVTFTVNIPITITASTVDENDVTALWIEQSLTVDEYRIMDYIRDYGLIELDDDWDTNDIDWGYDSATVTDYDTTPED